MEVSTQVSAPKLAKTAVIPGAQIFVPLADIVDLDEELAKMEKEAKRLEGEVMRASKKLSNEGFVKNAPEAVIAKEKEKQADYESQLEAVKARMQELKESR